MNIKIGIFLLSALCLQVCGLQEINEHKTAVQSQKQMGYLQKVKDFVKKYHNIIVPTVVAVGACCFVFKWRQDFTPQKTKINFGFEDEVLNNLPDYHGQKIWLSDDAKAHLKQLLQRVCNGETNDPAGEFLRYLRKPGILHMDQAGIRTITMRIDQNPEFAKELICALMVADVINNGARMETYQKLLGHSI